MKNLCFVRIYLQINSDNKFLITGSVSPKNEANIMIKNAVDVIFGSLGKKL